MIICILYLFIITCLIFSMALLVYRGRNTRYNNLFLGCQISIFVWCVSQMLLLLDHNVTEKWIAFTMGNLGICFLGSFWVLFALNYGKEYKNKLLYGILFSFSSILYLLALTNSWHHLFYRVFELDFVDRGPIFYINMVYQYLCTLTGMLILFFNKEVGQHRKHAKMILVVSALVPAVMNVIYIAQGFIYRYDLTPFGFGVSIILVLFATMRYRFMDINISAFDAIIHGLKDGVLIFDKEKLIFSNEAFWNLTQIDKESISRDYLENYINKFAISQSDLILYKEEEDQYLSVEIYEQKRKRGDYAIKTNQTSPKSRYAIYMIKDVSQYYQLVEKNKELAISKEQFALAAERARIAQKVHDTTGHTLVMIQSLLKLSRMGSGENQIQAEEYLTQAQELTREGLKELRESINEMTKEESSELVTQAVMQLTRSVKEIKMEVTIQGEDDEMYSSLTKVVHDTLRESITNCLKYSKASQMDVVVRFLKNRLELVIADDGVGCEEIVYNHGLKGICDRIEEKGGKVKFTSALGEGFMTRVILPLT